MMGPLQKLFKDPDVTEIMVDGPHLVRIEKRGAVIDTKVRFKTARELERLLDTLHGEKGTAQNPVRESRLEDGTRVVSVAGTATSGGPFLLISKARSQPVTWEMYQDWKFLNEGSRKILQLILAGGHSILTAGSAGSGLTTTVNLFSSEIPAVYRVIGIESDWHLQPRHPHLITLLAKGGQQPWVQTALKLRPDAIVVGEIVGSEAFELVRAAQDRIQIIGAVRATGVADALRRIELCCLQSNAAWSVADHRTQIAQSLRFVTFQERLPISGRRVLREIAEVVGIENGQYQLEPLMRWNERSDEFEISSHGKAWLK